MLIAGGCAPSFPPLAERGGDSAFKARIAATYPPGSSGERLRADLAGQGFTVVYDPVTRLGSALDVPPNLPCLSETRIDWRENARGRIVLIQAARHTCS